MKCQQCGEDAKEIFCSIQCYLLKHNNNQNTVGQVQPTVGAILQKIYDSEIHLSIGWLWDGGVDYSIGTDLSYLHTNNAIESTGLTNIDDAIAQIANEISMIYPESSFAKWWGLYEH